MKKLLVLMAALSLAIPLCVSAQEPAAQAPKEFVVYTDKNARDNHFIPSGWMGDTSDIKMNDQSAENPQSGATCIQFVYGAKKAQGQGWAGVVWQNPANNWGSKKGGFDLTGMTKLTFWARGAKGGEVIQKFTVGGIKGTYPDTVNIEIGPVELTDSWKQYTVNLAGKDLSYLSGGFGWSTTADLNPEGATFYIDNIKFEADPAMKPEGKKKENMPFYVYADRSTAGNHYIPSGYMGDYGDLKYDGASKEDPYLGDTCIKIIYSGKITQGARWAGIYWQNPANNWGSIDAGFDLSKAAKITLWARGAKGGERIEEFKVGGIMGEFSDSDSASVGPVILNKEWTQYTIDLKGKDLSYIVGGFCFVLNIDNNPEGAVFYLDEIKYE
ncbi:MAG: hypothetical protein FJZ09_04680 [Candidatus Omnitrophica bacterium]|nr:hypothetical protein [Candidatus Omnitrophota bacterium]